MKIDFVAEIGQGFEGNVAQAKLMLQAAASAGADGKSGRCA